MPLAALSHVLSGSYKITQGTVLSPSDVPGVQPLGGSASGILPITLSISGGARRGEEKMAIDFTTQSLNLIALYGLAGTRPAGLTRVKMGFRTYDQGPTGTPTVFRYAPLVVTLDKTQQKLSLEYTGKPGVNGYLVTCDIEGITPDGVFTAAKGTVRPALRVTPYTDVTISVSVS